MIAVANGFPPVPCLPIAEIALIVERLPCNETGLERVFSWLKLISGDHRRSIQADLIDALLVITCYGVSHLARSSRILDNIDRDFKAAGDGHVPHDERGGHPPPR
jgi:hypothetical protein